MTRPEDALPGCSLPPPALAARLRALRRDFSGALVSDDPDPGRVRLRFADTPERSEDLLAFIRFERACCRPLRFALAWEPEGGPVTLEIRGPEPLLAAFREAAGS